MKNFKNLDIWQRSMAMVKSVYVLTDTFPKTEVYGLTSQIRRAMVSIPSNIAEGCGKNSTPDFARFLDMALGSAFELETQLIVSENLGFVNSKDLQPLLEELTQIQKMINKYNQALRTSR